MIRICSGLLDLKWIDYRVKVTEPLALMASQSTVLLVSNTFLPCFLSFDQLCDDQYVQLYVVVIQILNYHCYIDVFAVNQFGCVTRWFSAGGSNHVTVITRLWDIIILHSLRAFRCLTEMVIVYRTNILDILPVKLSSYKFVHCPMPNRLSSCNFFFELFPQSLSCFLRLFTR